jgi:hypothetical protein
MMTQEDGVKNISKNLIKIKNQFVSASQEIVKNVIVKIIYIVIQSAITIKTRSLRLYLFLEFKNYVT